jgi:hypothetical protein
MRAAVNRCGPAQSRDRQRPGVQAPLRARPSPPLSTVQMHLSNAFRKLDVSSRSQVPAALPASEAPVAAGG